MGHRRGPQDERWKKLKIHVRERDNYFCQLMNCLTAEEAMILISRAPRDQLATLDLAHCFSVGNYPHLCYEKDNVVLLNRYSHQLLDHNCCPLTGRPITMEERIKWWKRILGENRYQLLEQKAKEVINE